jgi:hypothetical protein
MVRFSLATAVAIGVAAALLTPAAAASGPAGAAPVAAPAASPQAAILARKYGLTGAEAQAWLDRTPVLDALEQRLTARLPDRYAGIWTEGGRRVSVAVVGADRADVRPVVTVELRAHGLAGTVTVRTAANSLRQLRDRAKAAAVRLNGRPAEVAVSVPANTVEVRVAPPTGPAARRTLGDLAGSVRLTETAEVTRGGACASTSSCTPSHGGSFLQAQGNGFTCSLGLPARSAADIWYAITAGHCIHGGTGNWGHANTAIGPNVRWEYGTLGPDGDSFGTDIGAFRYDYHLPVWNARSRVILTTSQATLVTQPIRAAMESRPGDPACMTGGRSTYTDCGVVQNVNTYRNYASPGLPATMIYDLTSVTDVCLRPGDSGSPVFTGDRILGIGTAYNTACNVMHFARIAVALSKYKLSIIP